MTFGSFVLQLRERVQDIRMHDGTVITAITDNGVRWSSSQLISICNDALTTLVRRLKTYENSPLSRMLGEGFLIQDTTLSMTAGVGSLPATALMVLAVDDGTDVGNYGYVEAENWKSYILSDGLPRDGEKYFTVFYDPSTGVKKLYVSPVVTSTLNVRYIYYKNTYVAGDTGANLFLFGIDQLLLDVAEMECREREKNWDRATILLKKLMFSFGVVNG